MLARHTTRTTEQNFEAAISAPGAGPFTPVTLLRNAMSAAGCNPDTTCAKEQYLRAILAAHNVLKNAASLIRNTNPCLANMQTKAWANQGQGSTQSEMLCDYYSRLAQPRASRPQGGLSGPTGQYFRAEADCSGSGGRVHMGP